MDVFGDIPEAPLPQPDASDIEMFGRIFRELIDICHIDGTFINMMILCVLPGDRLQHCRVIGNSQYTSKWFKMMAFMFSKHIQLGDELPVTAAAFQEFGTYWNIHPDKRHIFSEDIGERLHRLGILFADLEAYAERENVQHVPFFMAYEIIFENDGMLIPKRGYTGAGHSPTYPLLRMMRCLCVAGVSQASRLVLAEEMTEQEIRESVEMQLLSIIIGN